MALLTGVLGGGSQDMLCSAARDVSSPSGMVPMHLLMSAFPLAPRLKLVSSRRSGTRSAYEASRNQPLVALRETHIAAPPAPSCPLLTDPEQIVTRTGVE